MEEKDIKKLEKDIKEEDIKANHKYVKLTWSIYKLCLKMERPGQKVTAYFSHSRGHSKKTFHDRLDSYYDSDTLINNFRKTLASI